MIFDKETETQRHPGQPGDRTDREKRSKTTLEAWTGMVISQPKVNRAVRTLLRRFVLEGGFDVDTALDDIRITKSGGTDGTSHDVAQR